MTTNKRPPKRHINGLLILDKPPGLSSNQALQRVRWLFNAEKAGHTGNLDPMATGVLPLCFGEATKFSRFLLDADKTYRATFLFGRRSDTGDAEGKLLSDTGAEGVTRERVEAVLPRFRGEIEQVPPMYSALKYQGKPLYELARAGLEVERSPRKVQIHRLEVIDCRPRREGQAIYMELDVEVACSKGTYIRSLAMDLGELLGCGALVSALHRSQAGMFRDDQAVSLASLEAERGEQGPEVLDHHLQPIEHSIAHLKAVQLPESSGHYFCQGQPVLEAAVLKQLDCGDTVRVSLASGKFLGVAEVLADGRIAPRRLVAL